MKSLKIMLTSVFALLLTSASAFAHVGSSVFHSHVTESNSVVYVIALIAAIGVLYVTYVSSTKTKQVQKVRVTQQRSSDFRRKN